MKANSKREKNVQCVPGQPLKLARSLAELWPKKLAAIITALDGWRSDRCTLSWRLKETRFKRFYLQLHAGRQANNTGPSGFTGQLLPTPTTGSNRNSRNAVLKIGTAHQHHGVSLGLAQVLEIASGILPKEFDSWSQVPVFYNRMLPTPTAREYIGGRHPDTLKAKGRRPSNSLSDTINTITGKASRLNAMFVLEMMGFPADWLRKPFVMSSSARL